MFVKDYWVKIMKEAEFILYRDDKDTEFVSDGRKIVALSY